MEVEEVYKKGRSSTPYGVRIMKLATLVLITRTRGDVEEILLAKKKTGEIGVGVISASGGKLDPGETLRQCVARETWEEFGLTLPNSPGVLEEVALLDVFRAQGEDDYEHFMRVFVFAGRAFSGEPVETKDMERPFWVSIQKIPYYKMYPGDQIWMPIVLQETVHTLGHLHFTAYRRNDVCVKMTAQTLRPFSEFMET